MSWNTRSASAGCSFASDSAIRRNRHIGGQLALLKFTNEGQHPFGLDPRRGRQEFVSSNCWIFGSTGDQFPSPSRISGRACSDLAEIQPRSGDSPQFDRRF